MTSLCIFSFLGSMRSLNLFLVDSYLYSTICLCTPSCMAFSEQFLKIGKCYYGLFFL
jgi:hypothetical protein